MYLLKKLVNCANYFVTRLNMVQKNTSPNSHIENYLNYYCDLRCPHKFAVLLKGKWGSGKSWFINQYCDKRDKCNNLENKKSFKSLFINLFRDERNNLKKQKSLYISLYGMTNFSEIEDALFQQLHPVFASKHMVIAGKIFKGLLKGTLKIDLDNNGKDDGMWNVSVPDIERDKIFEKFNDSHFNLLIFDDLERCNIEIENILGYINTFLESPELKVVIVANEDELINKDEKKYPIIKEKLIGKTFDVSPDFEGALNEFINHLERQDIKEYLLNNINLIEDLFEKGDSNNLRTLNQVVLDFERIFKELPEKAQTHQELVQDILHLIIIFSIEISHGQLNPKGIYLINERTANFGRTQTPLNKNFSSDDLEKEKTFKEVLKKYGYFKLDGAYPSWLWWQDFFDKGFVGKQTLEELLSNSIYFQHETTANWVKLWYYSNHTDEEFKILLNQVELEYKTRQFEDIGIIKHITGLFLLFSEVGLYSKNKEVILDEAKKYIDELTQSNKLDYHFRSENTIGGYMGLELQKKDSTEFQAFNNYIQECQEKAKHKSMPNEANNLLNIMQTDVNKFYSMICTIAPNTLADIEPNYRDRPIFAYMSPTDFIQAVISKNDNIYFIFSFIKERYKDQDIKQKLVTELDFLKDTQKLLEKEVDERKFQLSGCLLIMANKDFLSPTISSLEKVKEQQVKANN